MKNASLWALGGAALVVGVAYSCAVPVDFEGCQPGTASRDCEVILVQQSVFEGDASVSPLGGAGASNSPPPSGGASGSNSQPPSGAAGSNSPPSGGSAGQGQAGSGASAGAGGASGGAAGSGAAGSGAAGTGGAAGSGAAGTSGSAGSGAAGAGGTTGSTFNVAECNFANRAGCESSACATACPTGAGNYCLDGCTAILACVTATPGCVTEADPMCGTAFQNPYRENECTPEVNNASSPTTPGTPAFVALALVRCLCTDGRL